jgi:alkanesulfonate monooxygenase SsuD/methylene tetrahydromethanopterin reductase-like flavin-dependent oxidoreductase (luciferase family)
MVTCNSYRNPALLAKIASTVDVMSHGRLNFGIGAGWYEEEYLAYGYEFPDIPVRMGMFREAVELITRMWTEADPAFSGKYYRIEDAINVPQGVQQPHIPMWIGGGGEKVTLRLVAKYGAAANIGGSPDVIRHKLDVLKGHCDAVGRDYDEIIRSSSALVHLLKPGEDPDSATISFRGDRSLEEYGRSYVVGTSEQIVENLRTKLDAGINYFIIYLQGVAYDPSLVEQLATEVVPHLQG